MPITNSVVTLRSRKHRRSIRSKIQQHNACSTTSRSPCLSLIHICLAADVEVNYNTVSKVYMSLEQDGYIQSKRRQGAFVLDVSGKPGVSISTTAEIVTQEYLKRCFELGMSLEDIEEQFAQSMSDEKSKRDAAVGARA